MKLKGHFLSGFARDIKLHSECAFHCIQRQLEEKPQCSNHHSISEICIERFNLFQDIHDTITATHIDEEEKSKLSRRKDQIQENIKQ